MEKFPEDKTSWRGEVDHQGVPGQEEGALTTKPMRLGALNGQTKCKKKAEASGSGRKRPPKSGRAVPMRGPWCGGWGGGGGGGGLCGGGGGGVGGCGFWGFGVGGGVL